jgi:UPF0042 nucleotide-binding protein
MPIVVMSYGARYGVPQEQEWTVIDLRKKLKNPYHDKRLRHLCGLDKPVIKEVLSIPKAQQILNSLMVKIKAGEVSAVAFGCTAGRHRSVVMAEELGRRLSANGIENIVYHRNRDKWPNQPLTTPC